MSLLSGWWKRHEQFENLWRVELPDHVMALAWSPDDRRIAAATVSGPVAILDADTGTVQHTLAGHSFGTTAVAWVDSGTVATAGQDGRVRLWNAEAGTERFSLDAGASWVERIAAHPSGAYLAAASGKKVRLWNREGQLVRDYLGHTSTVTDLVWEPGDSEFTSSAYGGVRVWSLASTEPIRKYEWKGSVLTFAWSPNGVYLATGQQEATVNLWVCATGKDLQMLGYRRKVRELAWDRTGRFLATGGGDRVTVWDCSGRGPEGSTPLALATYNEAKISTLTFQKGGSLLASSDDSGLVALWRPEQGTRPIAEAKFYSGISQLVWSGDDTKLAIGTEAGEVFLFAT